MELTLEQKQKIKKLKSEGYSTRTICKELFGDKETRRTTVREFLKREEKNNNIKDSFNGVKIASLDIETSPCKFYGFSRFDQSFSQAQVISESYLLTYSVKYIGNDNILTGSLDMEEVKIGNDYRLCKELYDIINNTDIFIIQNGIRFDKKVINTRLLYHNFLPPSPYRIVDTYQQIKKHFRFPSNGLDSVCAYLELGRKIETRFSLWKRYVEGDENARYEMLEYNVQDVVMLEELFDYVKNWIDIPNLQVYSLDVTKSCPLCGKENFEELDKFYYTNVSKFPIYRCNECGKQFRDRKNILKGNDKLFIGI